MSERILYKFPDEVAARLAPHASQRRIWPFLERPQDFAHGPAHLIPMVSNTMLIAQEGRYTRGGEISPKDTLRLKRAALTHDTGYKLVPGVLKPEEHHYGSALIAWLLYHDEAIVEAILLHVQNIMPDETPYWMTVLQDGDRVSRMGWPMVEWVANYLGYRHPRLERLPQRTLGQTHNHLWDLRHPRQGVRHKEEIRYGCWVGERGFKLAWTDYEWRVERFVREKIFPFLIENNLVHAMLQQCGECMSWYGGKEFLPGDDTVDELGGGWTVTPVGEMAAALFEYKFWNTEMVLGALSALVRKTGR